MEVAIWKVPSEWLAVGMEKDHVELYDILAYRYCSSLKEKDRLAWLPNPKGTFTIASGYQKLLSQQLNGMEVQWWKFLWKKNSWPKYNFFVWTMDLNKYLTWDNIRKCGFQGSSMCILCGSNEEDSSHLFLRCPFPLALALLVGCLETPLCP